MTLENLENLRIFLGEFLKQLQGEDLQHLEEQRVAQEEARQEDQRVLRQRLAADQQQLSEWQQRSERQATELEEFFREMEICRRDFDSQLYE